MQIIIAGRGGQGVITLNYMLGTLSTRLNLDVLSAETHGMAMRGGSVYTTMKVGGYSSPNIADGAADLLISLDISEVKRNLHFLKMKSTVIHDGKLNESFPFNMVSVNAKEEALGRYGNIVHASTILMGKVISTYPHMFPMERSIEILKENKKINIEALNFGALL